MKTKLKKYAALFCTLCTVLLVLSGCGDLFNGPAGYLPEGQSLLILNVNGSSNGRTIAPTQSALSFDSYEVTIKSGDEIVVPADRPFNKGETISIELPYGTYGIHVKGLVDDVVVAEGVATATLNQVETSVEVELSPVFNDGEGTFAWDLEFHSSITAATMQIINKAGEDVGGLVDVKANPNDSDDELDAGEYNVEFSLTFDDQTVITWTETLHVYRDLTSTFTHLFGDLRSNSIAAAVQEKIEAKDGNQPVSGFDERHLGLLGIEGVDDENIVHILGAITWVDDLETSVDIALVNIHNFTATYANENTLETAINSAMRNGTTLTSVLVTEGNPNTAVVKIAGQDIVISGFSFPPAELESITIEGTPVAHYQYFTTEFDPTGLEVTATYSRGEPKTILLDDLNLSFDDDDYDPAKTDEQTIIATYNEKTAEIKVTVIPLDSIEIEGTVAGEYDSEPITRADVLARVTKIEAVYDVQKKEISENDTNLTVTVNEDAKTITIKWHNVGPAAYNYTLPAGAPTLTGIVVTGDVSTTHYQYITTMFNFAGLTVKAIYNDDPDQGVTLDNNDVNFTGYIAATSGLQTITAHYHGMDDTTTVTVIAATGLEITWKAGVVVGEKYLGVPEEADVRDNITGIQVVYVDGHKVDIKNDPNLSVTAVGTITIAWHGLSEVYTLAKTLVKIEIDGTPVSHYQYSDTTFNRTGLTVTATFSDGSTDDTVSANFDGYEPDEFGEQEITASFTFTEDALPTNTKTAETTVTVIALDEIVVTLDPAEYDDDHPTIEVILDNITVKAFYVGGHEVNLIDLDLVDKDNVVVKIDDKNGSVQVIWHEKESNVVTYTVTL